MGLTYGFRPRADAERLRLARLLALAPTVVGVEADDGWVAASLAISGRVPVIADAATAPRVDRALRRLGLPRAARGTAPVVITGDLRLRTVDTDTHHAVPAEDAPRGPLVSVIICGPRSPDAIDAAVASVQAQAWPCEAVVVDDACTGSALQHALDTANGAAFLVLGCDEVLLPGSVRVLASLLFADLSLAAVWGDSLVVEATTGEALGWQASLQLPPAVAARATLDLVPARIGACLVRRSVEERITPPLASLGRIEVDELLARWTAAGPVEGVPVPVCVLRAASGASPSAFREGWRVCPVDLPANQARFDARWRSSVASRRTTAEDRDLSHAWARGLYTRKLHEQARMEASRWPGPYTAAEAALRRQLGLPTPRGGAPEALIVVDDGDVGALEETLHRHAGRHALWVDLEVHREPLAPLRQMWEGTWGARQRLHAWVKHPGPWHLRLTSAPDWSPPSLAHSGFLPELAAPDAVLALAAVFDWPLPQRIRSGLLEPAHAHARSLVQARLAIRRGRPREAIPALTRTLRWMGGWLELWQMAETTFAAAGLEKQSRECARQVAGLSGAASIAGK